MKHLRLRARELGTDVAHVIAFDARKQRQKIVARDPRSCGIINRDTPASAAAQDGTAIKRRNGAVAETFVSRLSAQEINL